MTVHSYALTTGAHPPGYGSTCYTFAGLWATDLEGEIGCHALRGRYLMLKASHGRAEPLIWKTTVVLDLSSGRILLEVSFNSGTRCAWTGS